MACAAARPGRRASSPRPRGSSARACAGRASRSARTPCSSPTTSAGSTSSSSAARPAARSSRRTSSATASSTGSPTRTHTLYVTRSHRARAPRTRPSRSPRRSSATSRVALFPEGTTGPGDRSAAVPLDPARAAAPAPPKDVEVRPVAIDYGAGAPRRSAGISEPGKRQCPAGPRPHGHACRSTVRPARAARPLRRPQATGRAGARSDRRSARRFKFRAALAYRPRPDDPQDFPHQIASAAR